LSATRRQRRGQGDFQTYLASSPSSEVLEDLERKGRCGDLCNERFVPISSKTTVKILGENLFGMVRFPQNLTEMKPTKQQTSFRKILYKMHESSCTVFSYKESAFEIPNSRREEE
jgi:hypothetical protein